jgi:hypothetical protein
LPVHVHFVELPLTMQVPAAQLNLQSAVPSHAKLQLCPALHVAVHFAFAGHDMLQLEGSASHLLSHVAPTAHAWLFPAFAPASSLLQAAIKRESTTVAANDFQVCITILLKGSGSWSQNLSSKVQAMRSSVNTTPTSSAGRHADQQAVTRFYLGDPPNQALAAEASSAQQSCLQAAPAGDRPTYREPSVMARPSATGPSGDGKAQLLGVQEVRKATRRRQR